MAIDPPAAVLASATAAVEAEPIHDDDDDVEQQQGGRGDDIEGEAADTVEIPTVELTALDGESFINGGSAIVAEHVITSTRDVVVDGGQSTRRIDFSNSRAEFISVTFFKARHDDMLGIAFERDEIRVSRINPHSLAADSPIRVGDKVLSVDSKDCQSDTMTSVGVANILKRATGNVTLVLHNEGGDSNLVESMVMKSNQEEATGLAVRSDAALTSVLVSAIRDGSKFANSVLNVGDVVLTINGRPAGHLGPVAAADIIRSSPSKVSVLARTLNDTGVVVAELSSRHVLFSSQPILRAHSHNNANTRANRNNNQQSTTSQQSAPGLDDNKKAGAVFGVILFLCIAGAAAAAVSGMASNV